MKILIIKTDNTLEVKDIKNDFKEMQKVVDGYIEVVHPTAGYMSGLLKKNHCFVCDEEGLCKDKTTNILGSILYNGIHDGPYQPIAGDIFICGFNEEDLIGLTDDEVTGYEKRLGRYLSNIRAMKKEIMEDR